MVEGNGLLNRHTGSLYRGFESHTLLHLEKLAMYQGHDRMVPSYCGLACLDRLAPNPGHRRLVHARLKEVRA